MGRKGERLLAGGVSSRVHKDVLKLDCNDGCTTL